MTAGQDALRVRPMVAADMDAVCALMGLAFADNPSTLANVRGDRDRAQRVMRSAVRVAKFGRRWSHAIVAVQDERILGALNAAPWPNCQLTGLQKIATVPAMLRATGTALPRIAHMSERRAAHDPRRAHWHIGPVGVRPDAQGHGVGSALLTEFLATSDKRGAPAFLETDVDRNVTLYQRHGFQVVESQAILGVETWFMWRDSPVH